MGEQRDAAGNLIIPGWVDDFVAELLADYIVLAGPSRSVLIGRFGGRDEDRMVWHRADRMESSILGDTSRTIAGPYKNAILTRLRKGARHKVEAAKLHPHTRPGGVLEKRAGFWYHRYPDGDELQVCRGEDAMTYNTHWISKLGYTSRLGLASSGGNWTRVVGVLADGDVAYPGLENPLEIIIPCPQGLVRRVIFVIEQGLETSPTYDVLGFTLGRDFTTGKGELSKYDGPMSASYYPYEITKDGKTKWDVIFVPGD